MKNYEITIKNYEGMVIFCEVEKALNGTNALLKAISKYNLDIKDKDKILINEVA